MVRVGERVNIKINLLVSLICALFTIIIFSLLYEGHMSTQLMIDIKVPVNDKYQVFYDIGNGFNENDSKTINVTQNEKIQRLSFSLPPHIKNLRIDLGTSQKTLYLEKIIWKSTIRKQVWEPENIIEEYKIKNNIEHMEQVNGLLKIVSNGVDPFLVREGTAELSEYLNGDKFQLLLSNIIIVVIGFFFFLVLQASNMNVSKKLVYISKNFKEITLSTLFIGIITLPMLSNYFGIAPNTLGSEKRSLAEKPRLHFSDNSYKSFISDYENYVRDNFGFRETLIRFNNILKVKYLNVSPVEKVIIGKKGWLFYNGEGVINDYRGTNHFSDIELEKIKNNLNERKKWLEENDIKFYITVAPNKHTIYSEYLPSNIDKYNEKSRLDQLIAYLSKNSEVEIIDSRTVLMENKEQYTLYKKNDTHWNSLGAFLAYSEIANSLKKDSVDIEPMTLDHYSIQKITSGGDLANMLSMNDIILDENLILSPNFESEVRDVEVEKNGYPNPDSLVAKENTSAQDHPKLLMFRDSFSTDMIPFLSENFSRSVYIWDHVFNTEIIEKEKPDVVIYEIVERNIQTLLSDNVIKK